MKPWELLAVFAGGGAGAVARFVVARGTIPFDAVVGFPWATFVVNVVGSAVLGVVAATCHTRTSLLLLLGTGFCGGFTTFSAYAVETVKLLEENRPLTATLYSGGSVAAGLLAAYLTLAAFRR